MSRIEKYEEDARKLKADALFEEIDIRSKAARLLAESFELDDIMFEPGCDKNGVIKVRGNLQAIKELAAISNSKLENEVVTYSSGKRYMMYYFVYNGTKFEWLDWTQLPEEGNNNASV